ncbi:hypothetical protein GCM10025881_06840 [Pseudolysinimonas kribbensis]|uniref:Uncharacterized protein n=1 Tax=Pseudolysinimonas kribbensis TaxID=433641 RepID=A0ABQ6K2R3_9MICO|nr:hypothetical protein GCM10025881_06840 [Pseudolysinimonas kribbensis]
MAVDRIGEKIRHAFLRRFAVTQGGTLVGRALPFGIGAVVGGTGNHLLGRKVVQSARSAFGPAPATFPEELAVILRASRPRRVGVPDALRRLPKRLPLPSRAADHPRGTATRPESRPVVTPALRAMDSVAPCHGVPSSRWPSAPRSS